MKIIYNIGIFIMLSLYFMLSISAALSDNLVNYYEFSTGTGSTLFDRAGSDNGNLINTPTWSGGIIDGGLTFDETQSERVEFSHTITGASGTFNIWFKLTTDDYGFLYGRDDPGRVAGDFYILFNDPDNKLYYQFDDGTTSNQIGSTSTFTPGNWYMVTILWGTGGVAMHIDGDSTPESTHASTQAPNIAGGWFLADIAPAGSGNFLPGELSAFGLWDRRISTAEMSELWNSGAGKNPLLPIDTCTCPGLNQNWEIDMSDFCVIQDDCDLGTGTLSFTGTGNATLNSTIDTTNLGDPGSGGTLFIQDSCLLTID